MIKIFWTQRWQFVPPLNVPKLSMILMTLKTRWRSNLRQAIKDLVIMHLGFKYQVSTSNAYYHPFGYNGKIQLWLKIQKWWCSDLIQSMPCSIHLKCTQVWYGTPKPYGLKTLWLFRWKPIVQWQRSYWYGWCMLERSSIDVSTIMMKNFQIQRWQFVPTSKILNVKTFYDPGDLETRSRSNLWHAIKSLVIMPLGYKYQVSASNG